MVYKSPNKGMTLIVKTVTRLTLAFVLIYGIYIVLQGHISPGGGFAGGIIIALSFIQLMLAFGKEAVLKKLNHRRTLFFASAGATMFLITAVLNFTKARHMVEGAGHFKILTAGLIPLFEIAMVALH